MTEGSLCVTGKEGGIWCRGRETRGGQTPGVRRGGGGHGQKHGLSFLFEAHGLEHSMTSGDMRGSK